MIKEIWLRVFSKEEANKLKERLLELSKDHYGELRVCIYIEGIRVISRYPGTLDDAAVSILINELDNMK